MIYQHVCPIRCLEANINTLGGGRIWLVKQTTVLFLGLSSTTGPNTEGEELTSLFALSIQLILVLKT
jgi:hypothetical protein